MCHVLQAGVSLEEERDFPARIHARNPGVGEIQLTAECPPDVCSEDRVIFTDRVQVQVLTPLRLTNPPDGYFLLPQYSTAKIQTNRYMFVGCVCVCVCVCVFRRFCTVPLTAYYSCSNFSLCTSLSVCDSSFLAIDCAMSHIHLLLCPTHVTSPLSHPFTPTFMSLPHSNCTLSHAVMFLHVSLVI